MKENTLRKLKLLLYNRRRDMLEQVAHLEFESEELEQRFIEKIDSAQKEHLPFDHGPVLCPSAPALH